MTRPIPIHDFAIRATSAILAWAYSCWNKGDPMEEKRSWWQEIKKHWLAILVGVIILVVAIALIILGYRFDWTGFNGNTKSGKTLWDWMQLLFIPVVLAIAGFWFNHRERKAAELRTEADREIEQKRADVEREIALDNQRERALREYIDKISELLLEKDLRKSKPEDEVRTIARVRTLTVLPQLDSKRKRSVIQFLAESNLIDKDNSIIDLSGADLSEADLGLANLSGADLSGANLQNSDLSFTNLRGADLRRASLKGANLISANLEEADLCGSPVIVDGVHIPGSYGGADLTGALLMGARLKRANLSRANLFRADLTEADLIETDLSWALLVRVSLERANLSNANLEGSHMQASILRKAILTGANLMGANLEDVKDITIEELKKQAKSLEGAIMPDGSRHP